MRERVKVRHDCCGLEAGAGYGLRGGKDMV